MLAPNPFVRYLTSMMYLSNVNGLSRINYPDSEFMKSINFEELKKERNATHLSQRLESRQAEARVVFQSPDKDRRTKYTYRRRLSTPRTLCACSALPFIEGTVEIEQVTYCEGALVDTVNFDSLLEEHPDLEEIWVSRIVDSKQIRKPENLHDALANLCQLFAATVGEDDVKSFQIPRPCDKKSKQERKGRRNSQIVEIHVPGHINFKWNHSNLDNGCKLGKAAAEQAIKAYEEHETRKRHDGPHFINENPEDDADWQRVCDYHDEAEASAAA